MVTEIEDPSGKGMFSKAGKYTSQKYSIFCKKDEILLDKRKLLKVSYIPKFNMKIKDGDEELNNAEIEEKLRLIEEAHNKKEQPKPVKGNMNISFKKTCARDQHFLNVAKEKLKTQAPPLGIYVPKVVSKHIKVLPDIGVEVRLNPKIERLEKWIDLKKLDDEKDIDIQFAEEGKAKPSVPILSQYKQKERYDLRNTNGTRFKNKYGYWPIISQNSNSSYFWEPFKKSTCDTR